MSSQDREQEGQLDQKNLINIESGEEEEPNDNMNLEDNAIEESD